MEELVRTSLDLNRVLPQAIKLLLAFVIALPIGLERERATRLMGLRTFPLVAVASCGYILVAVAITGSGVEAQARVLQGLITGIGFIGGGAILKQEDGVLGTATASSIWTTGAVGAAVAFGYLDVAILIAALNFIVLRLLTPLKKEVSEKEEAVP